MSGPEDTGARGAVLPVATPNPYRICPDGENGIVSFSGGRTSGYLLHRVIQAYGGSLPESVRVVFCNTGREMPQTLDFVRECSARWGVEITWIEYRPRAWTPPMEGGSFGPDFVDARGYAAVTYETASRNGEPFDALLLEFIKRRDGTFGVRPLPNPVSRICTTNLKTRLKWRYARGEWGWRTYHNAVGFRADEANRVSTGFKYPETGEVLHYPMHADCVTKGIVLDFWRKQPFDLALPVNVYGETVEGNCDLCFMKSAKKVSQLAARLPGNAEWWVKVEARHALTDRPGKFRQDRPDYAAMVAAAAEGAPIEFGLFDDMTSCGSHGCTD